LHGNGNADSNGNERREAVNRSRASAQRAARETSAAHSGSGGAFAAAGRSAGHSTGSSLYPFCPSTSLSHFRLYKYILQFFRVSLSFKCTSKISIRIVCSGCPSASIQETTSAIVASTKGKATSTHNKVLYHSPAEIRISQ